MIRILRTRALGLPTKCHGCAGPPARWVQFIRDPQVFFVVALCPQCASLLRELMAAEAA